MKKPSHEYLDYDVEDERDELQALNESLHSKNAAMLAVLRYIDSIAPAQPGDGSAPLTDTELVEITLTGKALKELRAAIAKAGAA